MEYTIIEGNYAKIGVSKTAETVQNTEETVEEFFDEDSTTEEPPIKDN